MASPTDEQLAEWRRLADAAWPGPWELELDRNDQQNVYAADADRTWIALLPHQCVRSIEEERERDAAFIAAARTAVPALLDFADYAIAEVAQLAGARDAYRAMLADVLASAVPNRRDHPTMCEAWDRAHEVLRTGVYTPKPLCPDCQDQGVIYIDGYNATREDRCPRGCVKPRWTKGATP